MRLTVNKIASLVGGTVAGHPDRVISGFNSIEDAGPNDLTFMRDSSYARKLEDSEAGAALVPLDFKTDRTACIQVTSPDAAFAQLLGMVEREIRIHPSGIHPSAAVDPTAIVGKNCALDAHVRIAADAEIGDDVVLYSGVYIGRGSKIGSGTVIYPNTVVREMVTMGELCIVHANTTIGSDGFGYVAHEGVRHRIPQIGTVEIGDRVEIGANTSIDRATLGATRIGSGTKIDNVVQIGHNVQIGEHCAISGSCGIAGSVRIGDRVTVGGWVGMRDHIEIGDDVVVGGASVVGFDIPAESIVQGIPAIDYQLNKRVWLSTRHLPNMIKRLRAIERTLSEKDGD